MNKPRLRAGSLGFTLIETMVIVLLIALFAAAIALTLPDGGGAWRATERFAADLAHARDEAMLGMRPVRIVVDTDGYRFERQDWGQWQALVDGPFKPVHWESGVRPVLDHSRDPVAFVFDLQGGAAGAGSLVLAGESARVRVEVDPDGEVHVE